MSKPTLDSIATAKAKLEEELRKLEEQEVQLRQQQSADAYSEVMSLLGQYGGSSTGCHIRREWAARSTPDPAWQQGPSALRHQVLAPCRPWSP